MRASLSEASSSAAAAAQQALVEDDVPDSQVKVREVSSVKTMATACRFVSRGNLVMFFTLLISVTCVNIEKATDANSEVLTEPSYSDKLHSHHSERHLRSLNHLIYISRSIAACGSSRVQWRKANETDKHAETGGPWVSKVRAIRESLCVLILLFKNVCLHIARLVILPASPRSMNALYVAVSIIGELKWHFNVFLESFIWPVTFSLLRLDLNWTVAVRGVP